MTLSGAIGGPGGLTVLGPSMLTLSGMNTYSGSTSLTGGTLQLGDGVSANGSVTGNIDVGETIPTPEPRLSSPTR